MSDYSLKDFNIKILGSFYEKDKTIFRVFAPTTNELYLVISGNKYKMHKRNCYFEIGLGGDLEKIKYYYINDLGISFKDPFAYVSDDKYSYVLDTSKFIKDVIKPSKIRDILIYETNVRDFSSADSYPGKIKRKLASFKEAGLKIGVDYSAGLDYLKQIGITHLQLMPILDFDLDGTDYNWGYNPLAYNYIKSDYILDDKNPYAYINEFRQVVNTLHESNVRVTLDVVFNHVYNFMKFDLDKMIPGHVFRMKDDGTYAAGSLCGNEIMSEDPFMCMYLVEMVARYIELFDIDGIRMDLMGILDYETVNLIYSECKKIKDDFIVYGEGWNMGDVLPEEKRAAIINADKIPSISMFNDFYRDTIINYLCGNDSINEDVKKALSGINNNMNVKQSINYVECHDKYTFFDRMNIYMKDETEENIIRKCKMALGLVMVSRGIPFIHSGEEFLRSKKLVENSYNSSDDINALDWKLRVKNDDVVRYFKDLVEIRRNNEEFYIDDVDVYFEDYYECLIYHLNDIMVIINPCMWDHTYNDGNMYDILLDIDGKTEKKTDIVEIPAYSIVICKR